MQIHVVMDAVLVLKHIRPKKSFLRLLQVKYDILTLLRRCLNSVVVGHASHDSRVQIRFAAIAF